MVTYHTLTLLLKVAQQIKKYSYSYIINILLLLDAGFYFGLLLNISEAAY